MGGKAVAQCMRTNGFGKAGLLPYFMADPHDLAGRQWVARDPARKGPGGGILSFPVRVEQRQ
jgi:hypothetical protein